MNYLTFNSSESMNSFLKRKIEPNVVDKIEYCTMEKFPANKILFTAEHAVADKIKLKEFGKDAYANVGDFNTGTLAKLAAFYLRSAYLVPLFIRKDADASRPPQDLGKGLKLFARVFRTKPQTTTFIPIHNSVEMLPSLEKYHNAIEHMEPKAIVSIHGMSIKRKFDVLFGFGEDYNLIGGKKQAFKFKNEFAAYLDGIFSEMKLSALQIAVSTWLLTGSRNYVLTRHVMEHNRKNEKKRIGMQVEFNWRGRVRQGDPVPSASYQIVVQALGDFILKWISQ
ncbi:MAG TPA: hypothetical protein VJ343_01120 [archaeon]|nr:hypothetical protein [archaeon]